MVYSTKFYQTFKELIPILFKLFHKSEKNIAKLFLWGYSHPDNQATQRSNKENYKPISFMNIDANIFNKTLANQTQEHIEKIIHYNQKGLSQRCRDGSTYKNLSL